MNNKDALMHIIRIICGLLFALGLGVLGLINYYYLKQWLGCTMTPNSVLAYLCNWGAILIFLMLGLDIFLGYVAFYLKQKQGWYAPILVMFIGAQIMLLFSISHANI